MQRSVAVAVTATAVALLAAAAQRPEPSLSPMPGTDDLAAELDRRLAHDIQPILSKFCLSCHEGNDAPNGVRLDNLLTVKDAMKGSLDLRLFKEMVGSALMPPDGEPKPTDLQRLLITQWLDATMGYVPPDAPIDPGWFTIHRLNRNEYRNTLRDLLGIDRSRRSERNDQ